MHIVERRRVDMEVLLRAKRYDGAVYLGGYVIECLLKAAVCQWIDEETLPQRYMVHDLQWLRQQAALTVPQHLRRRWERVVDWDVSVRYSSQVVSAQRGRDFVDAVEVIRRWLLSEIR